MGEYQVYSETYGTVELYGTKAECREFIKTEKQAQKDLDLPPEKLIIEKQ